jgi:hypothetical protein
MPIAFQLWFIWALLIYNIAYPPIKWCVEKHPIIWFSTTILIWLISLELPLIHGSGLLFFSLGVFLQKTNFDTEMPKKYLNPMSWGIIFIVSAVLKTYLAFEGHKFIGEANGFILNFLHKITEISGLISIWYGANNLVKWIWNTKIFQICLPFSFMIYVLHVPVLYFAVYATDQYLIDWQYHRIFTYTFIPLVIILASVIIGFLLRKISPTVYGILTGGRGL